MVGNSSSGLMEAASFALPVVNVGMRQQGRERAGNVIDVAAEADAILGAIEEALRPEFRGGLRGMVNPYGGRNGSYDNREGAGYRFAFDCLLIKAPVPVRTIEKANKSSPVPPELPMICVGDLPCRFSLKLSRMCSVAEPCGVYVRFFQHIGAVQQEQSGFRASRSSLRISGNLTPFDYRKTKHLSIS